MWILLDLTQLIANREIISFGLPLPDLSCLDGLDVVFCDDASSVFIEVNCAGLFIGCLCLAIYGLSTY